MKSEDLVLLLSTVGLLTLIAVPLIIILAAPAVWAAEKADERSEPPPTVRPELRPTSEEHRLARGNYRGAGNGDGGAASSYYWGGSSNSWACDDGGGDGGD